MSDESSQESGSEANDTEFLMIEKVIRACSRRRDLRSCCQKVALLMYHDWQDVRGKYVFLEASRQGGATIHIS